MKFSDGRQRIGDRHGIILKLPKLLLLCLLGGCSFSNVSSNEEFSKYAEQMNGQEATLEKYVGKTAGEIESTFGKPKNIYKANPPAYNLPLEADEMWRYDSLSDVPDRAPFDFTYDFLIKGNRVAKVLVN